MNIYFFILVYHACSKQIVSIPQEICDLGNSQALNVMQAAEINTQDHLLAMIYLY